MEVPAWSALSGVFTTRYDDALTELGRSIYHGQEVSFDSLQSESLSVNERYLFGVAARPWRFAQVNLIAGDEGHAPAFAFPNERGDGEIQAMLDPTPLSEIVALPNAGTFRIPGPPVEADLFLVGGLVILSSEYYEADMDQDLGILTSWRAFIRGRLAAEFTVEPSWSEL